MRTPIEDVVQGLEELNDPNVDILLAWYKLRTKDYNTIKEDIDAGRESSRMLTYHSGAKMALTDVMQEIYRNHYHDFREPDEGSWDSKYQQFSTKVSSALIDNDEVTVETKEFITSLSHPYGSTLVQFLTAFCDARALGFEIHGENNQFVTFRKREE